MVHTITLVNEGVMKCRFHGIHSKLVRGDVDGAIAFTKETRNILRNAAENEMSEELTEYFDEMLERTVMELKNRMFQCTSERIWTLAYSNTLYI